MDGSQQFAYDYAKHLLKDTPASVYDFIDSQSLDHPAISWQRSGAMALTGTAAGPALMSPAPLSSAADGALAAFQSLVKLFTNDLPPGLAVLRGSVLLTERAACADLTRQGSVAAGGGCHLIRCKDDTLAINLPRDDDWPLAQAWLETSLDDWASVSGAVSKLHCQPLLDRAREIGLAVSAVSGLSATPDVEYVCSLASVTRSHKTPLVLDLSALWAGPLAGSLLQMTGARVIKVESEHRLDGARRGNADFYELLNQNKESVCLDLSSVVGIKALKKLIAQADIVIESSRPRALLQMGIDADQCISQNNKLVWVSITAYGRSAPYSNWIGFGDDVGVAAGLTDQLYQATGESCFCGDAIADPLTGIHAALVAYTHFLKGYGGLFDISMHGITSYCASLNRAEDLLARQQQWTAQAHEQIHKSYPQRSFMHAAAKAGSDTSTVLAEFGI